MDTMISEVKKPRWGMGLEHYVGAILLAGVIVWMLWRKEKAASDEPPVRQEAVVLPTWKPDVIIRPFEQKRIELNSLRPEVIEAVNEFIRLNPRPVEPDK
jgi:hypothetical protein